MKGKRILIALLLAACAAGATCVYVQPIRANNTVTAWQMEASYSTMDSAEAVKIEMVSGLNAQEQPVEIYLKSQTEELGWWHSHTNRYDRDGNRVEGWAFDSDGRTVMHLTLAYDAHGNCISQRGLASAYLAEYIYDEKGRIVTQTEKTIDAQTGEEKRRITSHMTYTDHPDGGYTVQITSDFLLQENVQTYDAAGNVLTQHVIWDRDGRTTDYAYTYDAQNRPTSLLVSEDGRLKERTEVAYDVDGLNSRQTIYDSTGAVTGGAVWRTVDGPPDTGEE